MNRTIKRFCGMLVICLTIGAIVLGGSSTANAASEMDTAVAYLVEHGIYTGDANGNLNLDKSLTRAELAVIVTRLIFMSNPSDWEMWGEAHWRSPEMRTSKFTDVPDWAIPQVECCYSAGFIKGISDTKFDPQGTVTPQMGCTVLLRFCNITPVGQTPDWSYETAIAKAQSIGIAPSEGLNGSVITRGTVAIIAYRSAQFTEARSAAYSTDTQQNVATAPPAITTPETSEPTSVPVMTIDEMRAEIVRLTNEARVAGGLPELEVHPALMETAQTKAQDMVDNNYLNHISPTYGTPSDMIRTAIPQAAKIGENAAYFSVSRRTVPEEAVNSWLYSAGHSKNMFSTLFTHIGIGVLQDAKGNYYCVQHFAQMP